MQSEPIRPHRLYQRGKRGTWWVDFGMVGGVRHKRSTMEVDRTAAEAVAAQMGQELHRHRLAERIRKLTIAEAAAPWTEALGTDEAAAIFGRLWKNSRSRAARDGLMWALSIEDFDALVRSSNGRCAVTALPFSLSTEPRHPFKPSLDRIDNSMGYSIGNTRVVLMAVNLAMNVWGHELFKTIALSFAAEQMREQVQIGNISSRIAG